MIEEIKKRLLEDPDKIVELLEMYSFYHVSINHKEIRCAYEEDANPSSIRVKLQNNDALWVTDYGRNLRCDLIQYIIKTRNTDYIAIISVIKELLGVEDFYVRKTKKKLFGGFYENIRSHNEFYIKRYDEEVLDNYEKCGNIMFLEDGIDLITQRTFGIGYDIENDLITIPIRDSLGSVVGVKGRANYEVDEFTSKYWYIIPCAMSQVLYGYSTNYADLVNNTIFVFESEKSVLKAYRMGYKNCVALGSNSLSATQAKLLLSLNPQGVVFMLDQGLDLENTKRNAETLKSVCMMRNLNIQYWNWTKNNTVSDKDAPVDKGQKIFEYILQNEIETVQNY